MMKASLLVILATAISIGCNRAPETASAATPNPAPVSAASPSVSPRAPVATHNEFVTSGPIIVENQLDIGAQRDGVVTQIFADIGKNVRKGEVLATLDNRQVRADYDAASARYRATAINEKSLQSEANVALADLRREELMSKSQLITQEQLEHARFKKEAADYEVKREHEIVAQYEATMRSLQMELAKMSIVAPFSGVVARRYVHIGQKVAPNDRLFWLTSRGPLRVTFTLPQEFLSQLKRGSVVTVAPPFDGAESQRARVIAVSPVVDPSSSTIEVVAELETAGVLRPGMSAAIHVPRRP